MAGDENLEKIKKYWIESSDKNFKTMVALQNNEIVPIPLVDVVGTPYLVPLAHDLIKTGRSLGISFGD